MFERLISVIGSQALQNILNETIPQLVPFFPALEEFKINVLPKLRVDLTSDSGWDEKKTLAVAVLLQSILKSCRSMVIGSSFLDIPSLAGEYRGDLEKISFFEYMKHANEFSV
jgi:hypothetical protein